MTKQYLEDLDPVFFAVVDSLYEGLRINKWKHKADVVSEMIPVYVINDR